MSTLYPPVKSYHNADSIILVLTRIEYLEKLIKKMENYILDQLWNNDQVVTQHLEICIYSTQHLVV